MRNDPENEMNGMGKSKVFGRKSFQVLLTNASENSDKVDQSALCFNFPSFELTHRTKSHLNIYACILEKAFIKWNLQKKIV